MFLNKLKSHDIINCFNLLLTFNLNFFSEYRPIFVFLNNEIKWWKKNEMILLNIKLKPPVVAANLCLNESVIHWIRFM